MRTEKRRIGDFGESIACKFLMKRDFAIVERNYLRPWGEIDIVAKSGSTHHFVEVKTVKESAFVTHETENMWRAEDNIHPKKLERLYKIIQTYLLEKGIDSDWQLDAIIVEIDDLYKRAKVRLIENIVL